MLKTDPYLSTTKTDTLKKDLYSTMIKEGYKRLIQSESGPKTDLTKVFFNIYGGKSSSFVLHITGCLFICIL